MAAPGKRPILAILRTAVPALLLLATGCGGMPQYTQEDLSRLGAREVTGVIVKPSHGSLVLKTDAGAEETYRTWQRTQYMPEDYRSLEGDRVRVAYQEIMERSGRAKLAVLQLEALEIPEKNRAAASPVTGTVTYSDSRGYIHVRPDGVPEGAEPLILLFRPTSKLEEKKPSGPSIPGGMPPSASTRLSEGNRVWVDFVREPILRGNGYYYKIKTLRIL